MEERRELVELGIKDPKAVMLPAIWNMNKQGFDALVTTTESQNRAGSTGLYATIPIKCKGEKCPLIDTCYAENLGIDITEIIGQVCPIECAEIMRLFNRYLEQFHVDDPSDPECTTVVGLIKDLIDYDIQLRRVDRRLMIEADYLEDRCVAVDPASGNPIFNKEISKHIEYKERINKKRYDVYQLLNSTPKDKAGSKVTITMDPSTYAAALIAKAQKDIIEVEADDTYNEVEVDE